MTAKVKTAKADNGAKFASGVRCHLGHSGNQRLYGDATDRWFQCAGCGNFRGRSSIAEEQAEDAARLWSEAYAMRSL